LNWDLWLGPAPEKPYTKDRCHYNFRWISDYSGGIVPDWGCHLFDTAQWAADMERTGPVEVEGTGTYWDEGLFDTLKTYDVTYRYANGLVMTCTYGKPSIKFIGSDGWVGNTGWRGPIEASSPKILNAVIGEEETHLYTNIQGEQRDFLDCIKSRKDPYFPVDIGHRVATVCHMADIAIKVGRKLKWDPKAEVFVGNDEANKLRQVRPMRKPWSLT
jgi:predicted dehydrogenase